MTRRLLREYSKKGPRKDEPKEPRNDGRGDDFPVTTIHENRRGNLCGCSHY
ncbi:MAG: hypothetical protein FWG98_10175 [Candidatus Cloacimonetes bacterium]|nr:hypothetical protein [Candidatus Cloacimonadota bacterium]